MHSMRRALKPLTASSAVRHKDRDSRFGCRDTLRELY